MIRFLMNRPVSVGMCYAAIVILGAISYLNLSIEGQPDVGLPQLVVQATWGDTSPEVVQIFLTSPIEEVAAQVEGVEEIVSSSTRRQGAQVTVKFNRETDMDFARLDLNERLSKLREDLPPGASQPVISEFASGPLSDTSFMTFTVSGPYDLQRLTEIVKEEIRDSVGSLDGVADISIFGERDKQLRVELDREKMDLYGLVPNQVLSRVNALAQTYETSRTRLLNQEYTITIENSIADTHAVEDLVVWQFGDQLVRVKDLGNVSLGYAKVQSYSRINGNPTLRVDLEKEVGTNVIQAAKLVRSTVQQRLANKPEVRVDWIADEGEFMEEQLQSIYRRGVWCVGLIIILLLFFLRSASSALVITLNILFSVLITVNFMYYFGLTFNIMTLSGLAIGFGMFVDNAIVVLENIFRHRENGATKFEAAILGAQEVVWPIVAATLTTVAAFGCMLWLEDRLSVVYLPLAIAVIFSLSASLVVSFTFTPILSLMIRGSALQASGRSNLFQRVTGRLLDAFTERYRRVVSWSLHHKLLVLVVAGSLGVTFFYINKNEIETGGFSFFFGRNDQLSIFVRMPEGAELETTDHVIRQFEEPLLEMGKLQRSSYKDVETTVYQNFARLTVSFEAEQLASAFPLTLKSRLIGIAQRLAGIGVGVMGISNDDNYYSGSTGFESYNSSVRLLGYNYKKLMDYGNDILSRVKRDRRVKSTKLETSSNRFGASEQTETLLLINREELKNHDIDIEYLLGFIGRNLQVESRSRTKFQGEEMYLEVKFEDADEFDIKDLESLVILTEAGNRIRLADLVSLDTRSVSGGIDRKDQQYSVSVRWDYRASAKKARNFNEAVFESLELPPGFSAELDFTEHLSEDETRNILRVFGFAALLVFMIIAALYESFVDPLVIFLTIPLSLIGVVWIYWFTGQSFDSTSMIGLIILAGIVVNNSILLVSHINTEVRLADHQGEGFYDAIARACRDRLRPVLLTAITTIVGLLPLLDDFVRWMMELSWIAFVFRILDIDIQLGNLENQGLQTTLATFSSLSRSTVGGMLSATLSTLLVIPVVYAVFFRAKQWLHLRIEEVFELIIEIKLAAKSGP